jgi:menaquinol-cytochrome c reductase cytochrome b subunit
MVASIVLHLLYLVSMILIGYIKTRSYEPDFSSNWETLHVLQNEVAFGSTISPLFFLVTFIGVAVIGGILLYFQAKMREQKNRT